MTPKRSRGCDWETIRAIARELPGVEEGTSYGTPALRARKALFARLKADGETLVLRMDILSRDHALRAEPELFLLTDHYRDYDWILVRLPVVTAKRLTELLADALATATAKGARTKRRSR